MRLNFFSFFGRHLWRLDEGRFVFRVNTAKLKAKIGVSMVLREVFEWTAVILSNSVRQSSIDNIFRDICKILSPQ